MYTIPKDLQREAGSGRPSTCPDYETLYEDWRWMTYAEMCAKYGVCYRTMTRWVKKMKEQNHDQQQ